MTTDKNKIQKKTVNYIYTNFKTISSFDKSEDWKNLSAKTFSFC